MSWLELDSASKRGSGSLLARLFCRCWLNSRLSEPAASEALAPVSV